MQLDPRAGSQVQMQAGNKMHMSTRSHLAHRSGEWVGGSNSPSLAVFQSRARPCLECRVVQSAFAKLKQKLQCETLHLVLGVGKAQLLVWGECAFCSAR